MERRKRGREGGGEAESVAVRGSMRARGGVGGKWGRVKGGKRLGGGETG